MDARGGGRREGRREEKEARKTVEREGEREVKTLQGIGGRKGSRCWSRGGCFLETLTVKHGAKKKKKRAQ